MCQLGCLTAAAQDQSTALHKAASKGHEDVVEMLITESKLDLDATNEANQTPSLPGCELGFR